MTQVPLWETLTLGQHRLWKPTPRQCRAFQRAWQSNLCTCSKHTSHTQWSCLCVKGRWDTSGPPSTPVRGKPPSPLQHGSACPFPQPLLQPSLALPLPNGSNYHSGLRLSNFFPSSCKDILRPSLMFRMAVSSNFNGHLNLMSSWCLWKTLIKSANSRL